MKYLYLKLTIIFVFLWAQVTYAQFELKDSILLPSSSISFLKKNSFGDIFMVINDQELIKINTNKSVRQIPLRRLVTHVDTNLSLRTTLIYNYQELEILDDQLNPIQDRVNFNQYDIFPSAVAISDSQHLWYFNPIDQRLYQWNYQLKTTVSQSNMLFFKGEDTQIEAIHLIKNRIFLIGQNWVYEYDVFGNFKAQIQLPPHINYSISSHYIYLMNESQLISINLLNGEISTTDNFFNVKDFIMDEDQLFVIKDKVMYIYTRLKN